MSNVVTTIKLLKVDITPINQLMFNDKQEQFNFFNSKEVFTYSKCSYHERNEAIQIRGYVDELQECNYCMYVNSYKGINKYYYAWISSKRAVAKETTEITLAIDVFQTWQFDIIYHPSFIERMHTATDEIGDNTYPEDFELGDYVTAKRELVSELTGDMMYMLATSDYSDALGSMFGQTYSGYAVKVYKHEDVGTLTDDIKNLCENGKADAIAFIFCFPQNLFNEFYGDITSGSLFTNFQEQHKDITFINDIKTFNFKNKYIPFNNKLLCYPYNFITIKNSNGSNVVLKIENFNNINDIKLRLDFLVTQNPTFTLSPINYCGRDFSIEDSISEQGFGLCSWNNDNYSNWYAQHQNSIQAQSSNARNSFNAGKQIASNNLAMAKTANNVKAIESAIGVVGNLAALNFGGAISSGVNGILNYNLGNAEASNSYNNSNISNTTSYQNTINSLMASVKDAEVQPNSCKGDTSSCGLDMARGTATFIVEQTQIKPEYAEKIDYFFQMYGYKVNTVKNIWWAINTRKKWNYIKTINANLTGAIPQQDIESIQEIFDNGVTLWHYSNIDYEREFNLFAQRNEVI